MNWICSQIGAREHYAVARVLHQAGKLEALYTDFWATSPWRMLGKLTGKSSLATRYHAVLSGAQVRGFNIQALKASCRQYANPYEGFLQVGRQFGEQVLRDLKKAESRTLGPSIVCRSAPTRHPSETRTTSGMTKLRSDAPFLDSGDIFFSYDTGFLEPAKWVKARGGKTIVCQMDPARYEVDLVKEEEMRWQGWAKRSVEIPEAYYRRREEEWAVADLVMVNSEWTKAALMKQGVPESKLAVVPLAYEASSPRPSINGTCRPASSASPLGLPSAVYRAAPQRLGSRRKLHALFLGQVILRKGIQYLIEAARKLENEEIHFDVVGSIGISDQAVASAPSNMTFHGLVSRDRTEEFYRASDLFVLPTLSDGFALTQLEAMAYGLPVIVTPNCGAVVSDGVDGLIVPASDSSALAEAFQLLLQDPEKLRAMSESTKAKVEQFNFDRLGTNLAALEVRLSNI